LVLHRESCTCKSSRDFFVLEGRACLLLPLFLRVGARFSLRRFAEEKKGSDFHWLR
jgi:hypothetical protein